MVCRVTSPAVRQTFGHAAPTSLCNSLQTCAIILWAILLQPCTFHLYVQFTLHLCNIHPSCATYSTIIMQFTQRSNVQSAQSVLVVQRWKYDTCCPWFALVVPFTKKQYMRPHQAKQLALKLCSSPVYRFYVQFACNIRMTRCQISCTIEFHRDPISKVLSEW